MRYGITLGRTYYSTVHRVWNLFELRDATDFPGLEYHYYFGYTDIWFPSSIMRSIFMERYDLVEDGDEVFVWSTI